MSERGTVGESAPWEGAEGPSDAELISRVRGGDTEAYGELFAHHRSAALRLARSIAGSHSDADDLVSDAFVKVLHVLQDGRGPDVAFRAYLLTAVRRLHVDRIRATSRLHSTDDLTPYDRGEEFHDTVVAGFESGAAARAFASLPERWQMVLWHLEVEGEKPAQIAPLLGMTPNSVSALGYRAREGLRQAFLDMHTADLVDERCRTTHQLLGGYVRKGLSRRDTAKVEEHLDHCPRCTAIYLELASVNSELSSVLGPLVLGGAALAYLGSGHAVGVPTVGLLAKLGGALGLSGSGTSAVGVGAVLAVTAGAVATAITLQQPAPAALPAHSGHRASPGAAARTHPADPTNGHGGRHTTTGPTSTPGALPRVGEPSPGIAAPSPSPVSVSAPAVPTHEARVHSPRPTTHASPTSPAPSLSTSDPAVSVHLGGTGRHRRLTIRVTGLPAGRSATVRVGSPVPLVLTPLGPVGAQCVGAQPTCHLTRGQVLRIGVVRPLQPTAGGADLVRVTLTSPTGVRDAHRGNDVVVLPLR